MLSPEEFTVLIDSLAQTPQLVYQLVAGLSVDQVKQRSPDEQFSIIENICHLRDLEADGYAARISRIVNEDQPALPDIDGGRLAVERDYQNQDIERALEAFAAARRQNVRVLKTVGPDQFRREGVLEGVGSITLEALLSMMQEHDEGHLNDIRQIRRLILDR
jgi:DinB superfamily